MNGVTDFHKQSRNPNLQKKSLMNLSLLSLAQTNRLTPLPVEGRGRREQSVAIDDEFFAEVVSELAVFLERGFLAGRRQGLVFAEAENALAGRPLAIIETGIAPSGAEIAAVVFVAPGIGVEFPGEPRYSLPRPAGR